MTAENFVYWLQGYLEISNKEDIKLDSEQIKIIQDHIKLVLNKVTPDRLGTITPHQITTVPYCSPMITTPVDFTKVICESESLTKIC